MELRSTLRAFARYVARRVRDGSSVRRAAFRRIYTRNAWGSKGSVSGSGSESEFTASLRVTLPDLLRELGVRSVLDAPCGDFNWMQGVDLRSEWNPLPCAA